MHRPSAAASTALANLRTARTMYLWSCANGYRLGVLGYGFRSQKNTDMNKLYVFVAFSRGPDFRKDLHFGDVLLRIIILSVNRQPLPPTDTYRYVN